MSKRENDRLFRRCAFCHLSSKTWNYLIERGKFMKQTAVYKLSQWEKPDRIQMEDFNSDNARIEAALKAH